MKNFLFVVLLIALVVSCKNDPKQTSTERTPDHIESSIEKDNEDKENREKTSGNSSVRTDTDFAKEVENFITCKKAETKRNDCRNSITKVISQTFGLTEFNDSKLGYVVYDSIRPIAERSRNWLQLGTITQETIDQALTHVNRGGLALIIDTKEIYGHVVMILPGEAEKSLSWDMKLPKVLSLTNYKPEKSFSDKSLSYAMKKSDDLKIFIRQ